MAIYVPIIMYGLRLFIVVLQELNCLPKFLHANFMVIMDTVNPEKITFH